MIDGNRLVYVLILENRPGFDSTHEGTLCDSRSQDYLGTPLNRRFSI